MADDQMNPNQKGGAGAAAAADQATPQTRRTGGGGRFSQGFGRRAQRGLGQQAADAARLFWNRDPRATGGHVNVGRGDYYERPAVDPTMQAPKMYVDANGQTHYYIGDRAKEDVAPPPVDTKPAPAPAPAVAPAPMSAELPASAGDRSFAAPGAATANIDPGLNSGSGLGAPPQSRDPGLTQMGSPTLTQNAVAGKELLTPQIGHSQFTGGNVDNSVGSTLKPTSSFDTSPGMVSDAGSNVVSVSSGRGGGVTPKKPLASAMESDVNAKEDIKPVDAADIDGFLREMAKRKQ